MSARRHPLTIGLTGGVASGKSLASQCFEALGVPVLDADQVARAVVAPGEPALAAIRQRFGEAVIRADGQLDRPALRAQVFTDPAARRDLEAITHPAIGRALQAWRDDCRAPYCLLAVAILLESGFDRLVDRVLVVDVDEAVQLERLIRRDGCSETVARGILAAQWPRELRLARADQVLDNRGSPEQLQARVAELHRHYLDEAARMQRFAAV